MRYNESEKALRAMKELEEQNCQNIRYSGMSCQEECQYYGTDKCIHPEDETSFDDV